MKNEVKNFGFVEPTITPEQYILGGFSSLPKTVLQHDGKWSQYLPVYEPQFNENYDAYGCTVWGTENAIETLIKKITGKEYNASERFIYILAGVMPPGADPHVVAECIREFGLIEDCRLPMTSLFEEFLKPRPMSEELIEEARRFPYDFRHEWVWKGKLTQSERTQKIREALRYSPLGVSVTAWFEEDGVYVDMGEPNTHWCLLVEETEKGWLIFDSYDQSQKIISFEHNIQFCKRFLLTPKVVAKPSRFWSLVNWFMSLMRKA